MLAGTAAVVVLRAWFAPEPEALDDRLLGAGPPQAGDFAADVPRAPDDAAARRYLTPRAGNEDRRGTRARASARVVAWSH
ncbi:hypothetical protein [Streptomyces sp. SBT349]|uniref:hypothetical protein n=1 Tax=Streptomyces sp. SBT349 TaxID=1580539 RepID=UPI00131E73D9|nr:hypothetical protein [Streptomyces sp. SBT349]